jgi:hypothetical protein
MSTFSVCLTLDGMASVQEPGTERGTVGHWTEIIPMMLKAADEGHLVNWHFDATTTTIHVSAIRSTDAMRYLWLSLCRDEDLIARASEVCKEHGKLSQLGQPIALANAVELLRTGLKMRGVTLI